MNTHFNNTITRYREMADAIPESCGEPMIHKHWSLMTEDEKTIAIWYLRNHNTSMTRTRIAGHAIGCYIKEHGTITEEKMNEIFYSIV
jgi:hypothetical protein